MDTQNENAKKKEIEGGSGFEKFACGVTKASGSTYAFSIALFAVIAWGIAGPLFNFSEEWQLVINTGTTIVTFLMVFLIQKAQNKDSLAIHLKLNEIIASSKYSSNQLVDIENMTEAEMAIVQKYYRNIHKLAQKEKNEMTPHSFNVNDL